MQEQQEDRREQGATPDPTSAEPQHHLALDLTLYTLARVGMLVGATVVLTLFSVPLLVAAAVSVVVMMPLSLIVLRGLRRRVAIGMAERTSQRRSRRDTLRAQLRGEHDDQAEETAAQGDEQLDGTGRDR